MACPRNGISRRLRDKLVLLISDAMVGELTTALRLSKEAEKAKERFLANISHEIRTPANGILGNSQLLLENLSEESQLEMVQDIVESSQLLLSLLNDLIDQAKLLAGEVSLENKPFHIQACLSSVAASLRPLAESKGVTFSIPNLSAPLRVLGDSTRLAQVLLNLSSNAIKFSQADDEVRVALSVDKQSERECTLTFKVIDQGRGIPKEKLDSIFQPFAQVDRSDAHINAGAGLGLSIVTGLVQAMDGSIGVSSEVGKGSTFTVELPFAIPDKAPLDEALEDDNTKRLRPLLADKRILVAEDNKVNQRLMIKMLEKLGCKTTMVSDGSQAVMAAGNQTFDAYIFDIQMPNMGGIEALTIINKADPSHPAIAASAHAGAEYQAEFAAAGFFSNISKPIQLPVLRKALVEALVSAE